MTENHGPDLRTRVSPLLRHAAHVAGLLAVVALFAGAVWVLHQELAKYHLRDIERSLAAIPLDRLVLAACITALSYWLLTGYDWLAVKYIERELPYRRVALASFVAFVSSYNFGATLGGTSMRYRLYSAWDFSTVEIVKIIAFCSLMFFVGLGALAGATFVIAPIDVPDSLHSPIDSVRPLGFVLLAAVALYLAACFLWRRPVSFRGWQATLPSGPLAVAQLVISVVEIISAAAVLYVLLPSSVEVSPILFVEAFLFAVLIGDLSHVPGGLGVFEAMMLVLLKPADPPALLGSLLAFRALYDLAPLGVGAILLGIHEGLRNRQALVRLGDAVGAWTPAVVPRVLALTTFLGGAVLLFSGSLPRDTAHARWLAPLLPLPVIELSHFVAGLVGMGLLLLARGLQQRIDAAWLATVALLAVGSLASLVKGFDYHEALVLGAMLAVTWACRRSFNRRASLWAEPFTAPWIAATLVVLGASVWLGMFSYKRVEYSDELWWKFAFDADAPRFLRAAVGAAALLLVVGAARLLRPWQPRPELPDEAQLEQAERVVDTSGAATDKIVLLGDKALLFSDDRSAFVMYGVEGSSWVALGDPIGPPDKIGELAWAFHDLARGHAGLTVFYQAARETLPIYLDLGLSAVKLGEEARVPLADFSIEGSRRKSLRQAVHRAERERLAFAVLERDEAAAHVAEFREISDAWLATKNAKEKRFSLGYFDEAYVARFPAAVVRLDDRIVGFANLWCGANRGELSLDLMRYYPDAPSGVMDFLFIELMLWGRAQGYQWFNLGMAPLAGLESSAMAPVWNRVGALVFRYGEHFYNFQGLRHYKDKFDPEWRPKYLASAGGMRLPQALANVAALISGGISGVVRR